MNRIRRSRPGLSRREFLRKSFLGLGVIGLGRTLSSCMGSSSLPANLNGGATLAGRLGNIGPLGEPDENGVRVPPGFTSRVVARANQPVAGTNFFWHTDPDGAAVFPHPEGGWVYVSNREFLLGGVNAIRFDADGEIVSAYNILSGLLSRLNCSGGPTPWNTWLSCEEYGGGIVWECDPFGIAGAQPRAALGSFSHEAAIVDPATNSVYLTEDEGDGRFYRMLPDAPNVGGRPDLSSGTLQAMRVLTTDDINAIGARGPWPVDWLDIPNPNPLAIVPPIELGPTRSQVPETTVFDGGEGIWYQRGLIYFATKGDKRVWALDLAAQTLDVVYDDDLFADPVLDSVDNVMLTPGGDIVVVEDKSEPNQQAVALTADGNIVALVELAGQAGSEVTGPAFSPDGRHFYFSSQRGFSGTSGVDGITYCVTGPWFTP
jgi:secreted PhoX family phosphatase